jgi:anti-anti-sigma factor
LLIDDPDQQSLLLDLSDVDWLTAAGIGKLVRLHTQLRDSGGQLILDNVGERVFEVLEVAGLTELLRVRKAGGYLAMSRRGGFGGRF